VLNQKEVYFSSPETGLRKGTCGQQLLFPLPFLKSIRDRQAELNSLNRRFQLVTFYIIFRVDYLSWERALSQKPRRKKTGTCFARGMIVHCTQCPVGLVLSLGTRINIGPSLADRLSALFFSLFS